VPGEYLGASEEYAAGEGVYEQEGALYAGVAGPLHVDEAKRTIQVGTRVKVHPLAPGDMVLARVYDIYDQIASFLIMRVENQPRERSVVSRDMVFIRIGEIQRAYTENLRDAIKIGDVVRARIVEVTPLGTYISMKDSGLGVIHAYCSNCHNELEGHGPVLQCPECGRREPRRVAGVEPSPAHRESFDRPMGYSQGRGAERRGFGGPRREGGGGPRREGGFRQGGGFRSQR